MPQRFDIQNNFIVSFIFNELGTTHWALEGLLTCLCQTQKTIQFSDNIYSSDPGVLLFMEPRKYFGEEGANGIFKRLFSFIQAADQGNDFLSVEPLESLSLGSELQTLALLCALDQVFRDFYLVPILSMTPLNLLAVLVHIFN